MFITTAATRLTARDYPHKVRRYVATAFADALVTWLTLHALAFYTLHHLAAGETYIFAPRGEGLVIDACIHIGVFTGFFVMYTLPSFWVRAWLGWILRILMFGLFGVFLTYQMVTKVVAVVETPDHRMVFYRHFPLPPRVFDQPPNAEIRRTSAVVAVSFFTDVVGDLVLYPVYHQDSAGQADIERLRRHINVMRERVE